MAEITIRIENSEERIHCNKGITLLQLLEKSSVEGHYVAAYVDGVATTLSDELYKCSTVRFIERESSEGQRIYARTLIFILEYAVQRALGSDLRLSVLHPMGSGYYCKIVDHILSSSEIRAIEEQMAEIVRASEPITRSRVEFQRAMEIFSEQGDNQKVELHSRQKSYYMELYRLGEHYGELCGALLHSTSEASHFALRGVDGGFALELPTKSEPRTIERFVELPKLYEEFRRNEQWLDVMEVPTVGALNSKILSGRGGEIINLGEGLQEKRFAELADKIHCRHRDSGMRVVFIAGPSSSGKTTFAKRLSVQLAILGLKPKRISLDDYFVERSKTPLDENGEYDFEALHSLNIDEFNSDLSALLQGQEVTLPRFNFVEGRSQRVGETLSLCHSSILLIEGIHGLNPELSLTIPREEKFLIYVSALTALSLDSTTIIHTSDNRLLRRMVRDHNYRGKSAAETIAQWPSVRRGEHRHIFPFQEQADAMFNTALLFEFSILRGYAEPLLRGIEAGCSEYYEAQRLLNFLEYFVELPSDNIPKNSLFREFLGGSSFSY